MANLLAAIGQATPALQSTFKTIQEDRRSEERLNLEQEQGIRAQESHVAQQAVSAETLKQKKMETAAAEEKEAFMKKPWDIQTDPILQQIPADRREGWVKTLTDSGIIDKETGMSTQRGRMQAAEMLENNSKLFKQFGEDMVAHSRNTIMDLQTKLAKAQEKGNPDEIAKLNQQLKAAYERHETVTGGYAKGYEMSKFGEYVRELEKSGSMQNMPESVKASIMEAQQMGDTAGARSALTAWVTQQTRENTSGWKPTTKEEALELEAAKKTEKTQKGSWKVVEDKTSPTGYSYQDMEDPSKPLRKGAPKPGGSSGEFRVAAETMKLRKEMEAHQTVKDYQTIQTQTKLMDDAMKEAKETKNYVAADQSLITILNKMIDAKSVVRPNEYARTKQDLALWNRLTGKIAQYETGGAGLTNDDRSAIHRIGKKFAQTYGKRYNEFAKRYRGYATASNLDPDQVGLMADVGYSDSAIKKATEMLEAKTKPINDENIAAVIEQFKLE